MKTFVRLTISLTLVFAFLSPANSQTGEVYFYDNYDWYFNCVPYTMDFYNASNLTLPGITYFWRMDDGPVIVSSGADSSFTFNMPGHHKISLEAIDNLGNPRGRFDRDYYLEGFSGNFFSSTGMEACPGERVEFWMPDYFESIEWDLGDGTKEYGSYVSHTYPEPGTFMVSLRIESSKCGRDPVNKPF